MTDETAEVVNPGNPISIAEHLVPVELLTDDNKSTYLAHRIVGFTIRESSFLAGVAESTLRGWRTDDMLFQMAEDHMPELREKFAKKYVDIQFTRNFFLCLTKDADILQKDIEDMTTRELEYLKKIRPMYTPQQLGYMKQLLGEQVGGDIDFQEIIMTFRQRKSNGGT